MNEEKEQGVKNQEELNNIMCASIADEIARMLNYRGVISEEQLQLIRKKNKELFPQYKLSGDSVKNQ